jgi:hypothetical protein
MDVFRITLIALTMIMEARNQPDLGTAMVGYVIINRGGQERVEEVVYQDRQFAVWDPDLYGPGHSLRLAVLECHAVGAFPDDPWCIERWMDARAPDWPLRFEVGSEEYWLGMYGLATEIYSGEWAPPPELEGKRHFDNPQVWPDGLPGWLQNCTLIGDHIFCD